MFHKSAPYYEKEELQRPSLPVDDDKNSSKSEWEQEHEPIAVASRQ